MEQYSEQTKNCRRISVMLLSALCISTFFGCRTQPSGIPDRSLDAKYEVVTPPAPNQSDGPEADYVSGDTRIEYFPGYALASNKMPQIKFSGNEGFPIVTTIFLAITIDPSGNVAEVQENWMTIGPGGRLHDDLVKSVKEAVMTWKYVPARRAYWRVIDNDNKEYIRTETVEEVIIMKFSFTISGSTRLQAAATPASIRITDSQIACMIIVTTLTPRCV